MDLTLSIEDEIKDVKFGRPHVVILGAGASLAAFPNGERKGIKLPLMNNFIDTLGLKEELEKNGIKSDGINFEEIYSTIYQEKNFEELVSKIDKKAFEYFSQMNLPAHPTIYDHLVLSLREKDLIATFNWDPFLYLACLRNYKHVKLPHVVYLHGNVAIGYCLKHKTKGMIGYTCGTCGQQYSPSRLLLPVTKKNYAQDDFIGAEWQTLKNYLKNAFMVSIFGYCAPTTDQEAIGLMKEAWGDIHERELEEIEIIDIKSDDELSETWSDFIHTHHYRTCNDFYKSFIAKHPRRTCEAMWNQLMECKFIQDHDLPKDATFNDLYEWLTPLWEAEKAKN
jgi:hypothetical protein